MWFSGGGGLMKFLQRHPLPLSPQNYPLHGNEVNGFHSAPTTYNHTPAINGEGIMGKGLLKFKLLCKYLCLSLTQLPWSFDVFYFIFIFSSPWNKLRGHLTRIIYFVSAANRSTTAGSSGDEIGKALASVSSFLFVVFFFFKLVLDNKTIDSFHKDFFFSDKVKICDVGRFTWQKNK